ncbi:DUF4251 domain-containing protein [Algibacter mikhailovii]|nr:DUF4251 domain-containing protein [Algibacter mikhailovii]
MKIFKSEILCLKTVVLLIMVGLLSYNGFAQELTKKELKQQKKAEQEKEFSALIESKTFVFVGRRAISSRGRSIDLTTNQNYLKFSPELVDSSMPFFGESTGAGHYGSADVGLTFKGKPEKYTIDKTKGKYKIQVVVKDSNDTYEINITGTAGNSTLTIMSNRKSLMTYNGDISKGL